MKTLTVLLAAAAAAIAATPDAYAKQKGTSMGCTMKQIIDAAHNTAAGRECSRQQDQSVMNGTTFIIFVCTSQGVFCCPETATSNSDCTKISSVLTPKGKPLNKLLGSGIMAE